jgi:excinuclease UvrABC ATPase subunit
VIATGTPEDVAAVEDSATGQYMRDVLPKKAQRKTAKAAA